MMIAIQRKVAGAAAGNGQLLTLGATDWLHLAAAPTFIVMALLARISGGGAADMLCAAMPDASPFGGMVPMYVLMSVFHLGPWLKLVSRCGRGASYRGTKPQTLG